MKNGDVSMVRNFEIDEAAGEFVFFIVFDDWSEERYLGKLIAAQEAHNADWTACTFSNVSNGSICERPIFDGQVYFKGDELRVQVIPKMLFNGSKQILGNPCCKLYKEAILKHYNTRFQEKLALHEDRLFNYVYAQHYRQLFLFVGIVMQ